MVYIRAEPENEPRARQSVQISIAIYSTCTFSAPRLFRLLSYPALLSVLVCSPTGLIPCGGRHCVAHLHPVSALPRLAVCAFVLAAKPFET